MPHTMEIFKQTRLMGLSTDSIPSTAYEENFGHGRTHYHQSLLIGDEYKHDEGERRGIRHLMRLEKEIIEDVGETTYLAFGRHLEEIHVTCAHLEKKRTRLQTNTKTLEDLYLQRLETASPTLHDAVITHLVTASQYFMMESAHTDSHADLEYSTHDGVTIKTRSRRIGSCHEGIEIPEFSPEKALWRTPLLLPPPRQLRMSRSCSLAMVCFCVLDRGGLLVITHYFGSREFTIYEMRKGCSVWSVRYLVNTDDFMNPLPKGWPIWSTIWSIVFGEREDDSCLVINLSRKVVQYNLISKTLHEIYNIGSNQLDDNLVVDELIMPFRADHSIYEFILSSTSV
ncbi:hypothetical protein Tco_0206555 [Tanacetum coccineum]